jgi:hypothetical protein
MDETNSTLREEMKKVVRNQIRQNDPPVTKNKEPFNQERYIKRLNDLPNR